MIAMRCTRPLGASILAGALIIGLPLAPGMAASGPPVFTDGTTYSPAGQDVIAHGDLNGDGNQDLVLVENTAKDTVSTMLGVGDGTFGKAVSYDLANRAGDVATGDLNGDGRDDVVLANEAGTMSVLLALADGGLEAPVDYAIGAGGKGIALGDVNGDGRLDAVAGAYLDEVNSVTVWFGVGDGTFQNPASYATQNTTYSGWLALGDVDNDSDLDIVSCSWNGLLTWPNNGNGTFDAYAWLPTGQVTRALALGDLNHDGFLDVAFTAQLQNGEGYPQVALNDGTGLFGNPATVSPQLNSFGISVGDLNLDDNLDLVTSLNDGGIDIFDGDGTGTFSSPMQLTTGVGAQTQVVTDLNSDGIADIAGVNAAGVTVFLNAAPPTIGSVSPAKGPVAGGTALTIKGTGFLPGSKVTIAGKEGVDVKVVTGATIIVRTPAGAAGPADVTVTRTDTKAVTRKGAFTYEADPTPSPPPSPSPSPETPTPTPTPLTQQKPVKPLHLPKKVNNSGWTRLFSVPVRTNAGQNAHFSVVGTALRPQAAGEVRTFRVVRRKGAVWVVLSGTQAMKVRVRLHAGAVTGFTAYTKKQVYRTRVVR